MSTSTSTANSKGSTTPTVTADKSLVDTKAHSTPATSEDEDEDTDSGSETGPVLSAYLIESDDDEDDGHRYPVINDTIRAITAFKNTDLSKYPIDIKIQPLRDEPYGYGEHEQFDTWKAGIEVILRLYQVWPVVDFEAERLPKKGQACVHIRDCYPRLPQWRVHEDRMLNVAVALIYANLDEQVRANDDVIQDLEYHDPRILMSLLVVIYGPDHDDTDDDAGDDTENAVKTDSK
ncbi:hypothetical protein N7481_003845 [Penicillium waksmanii]|uniref:uncharacterized protein n=1 Tax=Penicillium waksmanii TaxID=69791 RepID=UPI002546B39C|nr:uncharacterized protein N7481_003845 [Penicillium waksmanii]KAJ5988635.1 hypothetical protein N7481_003845 [Penicillium waksmanii]